MSTDAERAAHHKAVRRQQFNWLVVAFGVVVFVGALIANGGFGSDDGPDGPSSSDLAQLEGSAYDACEQFVGNRLKAPATAEFSGRDASSVYVTGGAYTVRLTVDSENSFGANIRSGWTCVMSAAGDRWVSSSVTQTSG